jgi:GNAT superfamily N-acetyltransferase
MIIKISFEEIFDLWQIHLWPTRISKIESHSAMLLNGTITLSNFNYHATYFAYKLDNKIVGCNSGHKCEDNSYRSRGLFVFPEYRKQGIGIELLKATIQQGKEENSNLIWSFPRKSSWNTYKTAGFTLVSEWSNCENEINAYCIISV